MTDTDEAARQADCDRRIVDVICEHLEQSGLRAGAAHVREMAAEIERLKTEAKRLTVKNKYLYAGGRRVQKLAAQALDDRAFLLRYCRKLDPGATDEEILVAAGCEVPDDAEMEVDEDTQEALATGAAEAGRMDRGGFRPGPI